MGFGQEFNEFRGRYIEARSENKVDLLTPFFHPIVGAWVHGMSARGPESAARLLCMAYDPKENEQYLETGFNTFISETGDLMVHYYRYIWSSWENCRSKRVYGIETIKRSNKGLVIIQQNIGSW